MTTTHPAELSAHAVENTMWKGSAKDGKDDTWQDKPIPYHMTKGIRHATTALMIELGVIPPDSENHTELAITRLAFCLSIIAKRQKHNEHHV